jgi:hypothetical protein
MSTDKIELTVTTSLTVKVLKEELAKELCVPATWLLLFRRGRELDDARHLLVRAIHRAVVIHVFGTGDGDGNDNDNDNGAGAGDGECPCGARCTQPCAHVNGLFCVTCSSRGVHGALNGCLAPQWARPCRNSGCLMLPHVAC